MAPENAQPLPASAIAPPVQHQAPTPIPLTSMKGAGEPPGSALAAPAGQAQAPAGQTEPAPADHAAAAPAGQPAPAPAGQPGQTPPHQRGQPPASPAPPAAQPLHLAPS